MLKKKKNPKLVEAIILAQKNNLLDLGEKLSRPTRLFTKINLNELEKLKGDNFLVAGFVLGTGNINRKISISAMKFSESALEKLKDKGSEIKTIVEFIKGNKKLEGVKIL